MIQWALIATAAAALASWAFVRSEQRRAREDAEHRQAMSAIQRRLAIAQAEGERLRGQLERWEAINAQANRDKAAMRESSDPSDRARAATDVMRNAARRAD